MILTFLGITLHAQWHEIFRTPTAQQAKVLSSPNDQVCWFITNRDSLYKTTDGGATWNKIIQTNNAFNPAGLFVLDENIAFK